MRGSPPAAATRLRAWLARQLALEERARSGFALFPIGMMVAAVLFHRWSLHPPVAAIALLGAGAVAVLWIRASGLLPRAIGVTILGLSAGFSACEIELARTSTTVFSGEATVRIAGTVLAREGDGRGRYRYVVAISSTERPTLSRPPERARILVTSRHQPLPIGSSYVGLVRLRPPAGPAYPGAHDFAFGAFFSGLGAYGFSLGAPKPPGAVRPPTFNDRVSTLRLAMGDRIRDALPGPTGAVAAALITGERAGIPEEINEDLRITGLAHVLSISGFHMALVAGFFMLATRFLLAAVAPIALHWPTKKIAALVALAATGFYFLLAGDNAATERSFVMIAVMLGAILLDRPALTLRNVCTAAIIVIALAPHVVLMATFQMSFAATAALVGAYGAYARWRAQRSNPAHGWLHPKTLAVLIAGMALSSLIAGAATAPFAIFHFQRGAPYSLIANILATPVFSLWIMPLAMLAVLAMPLGLHAWPLKAMGWGLDFVFALASRLADALPDYPTGQMSGAALICFSAAILVVSFSASAFRLAAIVPVALGLAILRPGPPPDLLVFESGKDLATVDAAGRLHPLRPKPSSFVWDQWQRAFPASLEESSTLSSDDPPKPGAPGFTCRDDICSARTVSGITIGWTENYEKLDELCRASDVAIVARAIRATRCRDGGRLVTLRTLRRTGSLAVSRQGDGSIAVELSIPSRPEEWNRHRLAAWPEYWRRETSGVPDGQLPTAAPRAASDSGESDRPASPEP